MISCVLRFYEIFNHHWGFTSMVLAVTRYLITVNFMRYCLFVQFPSYPVVQLSGCVNVQLSSCLVVQSSGFPIVPLSCCIIVLLSSCPVVPSSHCPFVALLLSHCSVVLSSHYPIVLVTPCPVVPLSSCSIVLFPVVPLSCCPVVSLFWVPVVPLPCCLVVCGSVWPITLMTSSHENCGLVTVISISRDASASKNTPQNQRPRVLRSFASVFTYRILVVGLEVGGSHCKARETLWLLQMVAEGTALLLQTYLTSAPIYTS